MENQRVLSVGERIMYVNKNEAINCLFAVRIKGVVTLKQIATALRKIQQKHPLLRSSIQEVNQQCFFVLQEDASPIPIILYERKNGHDWERVMKENWQLPVDVNKGPLAKILWLKGAAISELILVCPHCITDGVSITALLNELLLLLDDQTYDIGPSQRFLVKIGHTYNWTNRKRIATKFKGFLGTCLAQLLLPRKIKKDRKINLDSAYALRYRFTSLETQTLLNTCKKNKISLYALMAIILLDEFKSVFKNHAKGKLICPVDIRKFLHTLKADQLFAFAPIIDLKTPNDKNVITIWERAEMIKEQMNRKLARIDINEIMYMNNRFIILIPQLLNHLRSTGGSHDFTFSNMGNLPLPASFETFSVDAVYSPAVAFPWYNPNTMIMSSYNGILDLNFMSNSMILKEEDATLFVKQSAEKVKALINNEMKAISSIANQ